MGPQEVTIGAATVEHRVEQATIMSIWTVAKDGALADGALAALVAFKPGAREPGTATTSWMRSNKIRPDLIEEASTAGWWARRRPWT